MNRNKGFTLVELLAVITLLSIMAIIAVPTVSNIMSKQKEKLYYDQLNTVIKAAQNWVSDNSDELKNFYNKCVDEKEITLDELISGTENVSYLDDEFINPKTSEQFGDNDDSISVKIYKQKKNYIYCISTPNCEKAKYDEYQGIASSICCNGAAFNDRYQACIQGI